MSARLTLGFKEIPETLSSKKPDGYDFWKYYLVEDFGDYSLIFHLIEFNKHREIRFSITNNSSRFFPKAGTPLHSSEFIIQPTSNNGIREALTILQESGRVEDLLQKLREEKSPH